MRLGTSVTGGGGRGHLETSTCAPARDGDRAGRRAVRDDRRGAAHRLARRVWRCSKGFVLTGRDVVFGDGPEPGWPLARQPLLLETSVPGVFAAGDVRHRSVKRVASAVGEGATAVHLVHEYLTGEDA